MLNLQKVLITYINKTQYKYNATIKKKRKSYRRSSTLKGIHVALKNRTTSERPCQRCVRYTGSSFTERQIGRRHIGSLVDHPGSCEMIAPLLFENTVTYTQSSLKQCSR